MPRDRLGVERLRRSPRARSSPSSRRRSSRRTRRRAPASAAAGGSPSQIIGVHPSRVSPGVPRLAGTGLRPDGSDPLGVVRSGSRLRIVAMEAARRPDSPADRPARSPDSASRAASPCLRKERQTSKNGSTYLSLGSATRAARSPRGSSATPTGSGSLRARRRGRRPRQGRALPRRARRRARPTSARIEPGTFDPAEFLPAAYRSVEELEGFLEHLIREIHDPVLRGVVEAVVVSGPARPRSAAPPAPAAATTPTSAA